MLTVDYATFFRQLFQSLFRSRNTHYRLTAKRVKWLILIALTFFFGVAYHWLFFLLDLVFFPRFLRQPTAKPVFIIGNFRTGSTLLHRIMARDTDNFATFKLWEIYLAPSVSQRKFFRTVLRLDRFLGGPIRRFFDFFEKKSIGTNRLHEMGMRQPEEEEGMLIFIWHSFWNRYFFPMPEYFAPYDYFDSLMPAPQRLRIMKFYRRAVQRHLYSHGGRKTLLSKNPCFTPKVKSLLETFPDARFIYLARDPSETAISKISWFSYWFKLFNSPLEHYPLKPETIEMMKLWYTYPVEVLKRLPKSRVLFIDYADFVKNPEKTIRFIYRSFRLPLNARFAKTLFEETHRARYFKSSRETTAESIGMSKKAMRDHFSVIYDYYRHFRFDRP